VTTLTVPARPDRDASPPPVPWRRMAWVTWRQHRLALAGVAAMFGAAAVYLLITGLETRHAYAPVAACRPAGKGICKQLADNFLNAHAPGVGVVLGLLQVIPALIGAFAAAPVLARELETGTFRYAWTQGFGRARWTAAKLVPLAAAVTVAAGAFSVLISWYVQPIWAAGDQNGPLYPTIFDLRGVALAAWTLAGFAIGALAGVLIRRVIPAMFAALAAWAGLAFVTGAFLRRHYAAPLITTGNFNMNAHAWVISQVWTRGGKPAGLSMINETLHAVDIQAVTPGLFQPGPATPASVDPVHYLTQHGYALLTTYQPASRFWLFQWIEGGWLLALSLLLIGATVWLVRRRAA
jgi:ABC-type transport system involved in multi-copper enzyme maturation permease subunit